MPRNGSGAARRLHRRAADVLLLGLCGLFTLGILVSGGALLRYYWQDKTAQDAFTELKSLLPADAAPAPGAAGDAENSAAQGAVQDSAARFDRLREENADFAGWLTVAGTRIDYPVMYRPASEDYYLRRDFAGQYSTAGVPYLEERCTFSAEGCSNNLIVYGHNMKSGTMFHDLTGYAKQDFYEAHKTITFDTLFGEAEYEVFAALALDVADNAFPYDTMTDLDPDGFADYVNEVLRRSYLSTGIVPQYGEQLLTLSTCEYAHEDGRFLVLARRIGD